MADIFTALKMARSLEANKRNGKRRASVLSHVKHFTVLLSEDRNVRHAAPRCNFTCAVASPMHDARNLAAMSPEFC